MDLFQVDSFAQSFVVHTYEDRQSRSDRCIDREKTEIEANAAGLCVTTIPTMAIVSFLSGHT